MMSCIQMISKCASRPSRRSSRNPIKEVYVLKLQGGRYYVGESFNIRTRLIDHMNGRGSAWTRKYPVTEMVKPLTPKTDIFWELNETLERMRIHGSKNVRGSLFSSVLLTNNQIEMAIKLYCERHKLCWKCGSADHLAGSCHNPEETRAEWVDQFTSMPLSKLSLSCIVCDKKLGSHHVLNYCSEFCRTRHIIT